MTPLNLRLDKDASRPRPADEAQSLQRIQEQWEQQSAELDSCWDRLKAAGDMQLGIPESFLEELATVCATRGLSPMVRGCSGVRC